LGSGGTCRFKNDRAGRRPCTLKSSLPQRDRCHLPLALSSDREKEQNFILALRLDHPLLFELRELVRTESQQVTIHFAVVLTEQGRDFYLDR
jgi:hypothetical protein